MRSLFTPASALQRNNSFRHWTTFSFSSQLKSKRKIEKIKIFVLFCGVASDLVMLSVNVAPQKASIWFCSCGTINLIGNPCDSEGCGKPYDAKKDGDGVAVSELQRTTVHLASMETDIKRPGTPPPAPAQVIKALQTSRKPRAATKPEDATGLMRRKSPRLNPHYIKASAMLELPASATGKKKKKDNKKAPEKEKNDDKHDNSPDVTTAVSADDSDPALAVTQPLDAFNEPVPRLYNNYTGSASVDASVTQFMAAESAHHPFGKLIVTPPPAPSSITSAVAADD